MIEKWKTRYTFTLLCFLGFATNYCMRVSLSVVIVAMVKIGSCYTIPIRLFTIYLLINIYLIILLLR